MGKIKPTNENLIKALSLSAKAHNVEFQNWEEDGQCGIKSDSVPVSADVRSIVGAFYNSECVDIDVKYGWNNVWLYDEEEMRDEVDEAALAMALPNGWIKELYSE